MWFGEPRCKITAKLSKNLLHFWVHFTFTYEKVDLKTLKKCILPGHSFMQTMSFSVSGEPDVLKQGRWKCAVLHAFTQNQLEKSLLLKEIID